MITERALDTMFVVSWSYSHFVMVACFGCVVFARTPSPCLVAELTHQPHIRNVALDFCRIDKLRQAEKPHVRNPRKAMTLLRNATACTKQSNTVPAALPLGLPAWFCHYKESQCFPGPATAFAKTCKMVDALGSIYGAELPQQMRRSCLDARTLKHVHDVLNRTWGPTSNIDSALVALDACLNALHPHQLDSLAAAYRAAEAVSEKTRVALRVACILVAEATSAVDFGSAYVADMTRRWQLKYCRDE